MARAAAEAMVAPKGKTEAGGKKLDKGAVLGSPLVIGLSHKTANVEVCTAPTHIDPDRS